MALRALQALRILAVFERLLVGGADQDFQQILGDHGCIVRHILVTTDPRPFRRSRQCKI